MSGSKVRQRAACISDGASKGFGGRDTDARTGGVERERLDRFGHFVELEDATGNQAFGQRPSNCLAHGG